MPFLYRAFSLDGLHHEAFPRGTLSGPDTAFSHTNSGRFVRAQRQVDAEPAGHPAIIAIPFTGQGLTS